MEKIPWVRIKEKASKRWRKIAKHIFAKLLQFNKTEKKPTAKTKLNRKWAKDLIIWSDASLKEIMDGQKTHEKRLNIVSHQGNANYNPVRYNQTPTTTVKNYKTKPYISNQRAMRTRGRYLRAWETVAPTWEHLAVSYKITGKLPRRPSKPTHRCLHNNENQLTQRLECASSWLL